MNGLGRYTRVLKYINELEDRNPKRKTAEIKTLHQKLKHTGYKLRTLEIIRTISFILLYSSITSAIVSAVPGFESVSKTVVQLSSLIGSTIFLAIVGMTSKLISWYLLDLNLISSELIAIHKK